MTCHEINDFGKSEVRNGYIHLSFNLGSKQNVDDLTQKMQEDGFNILSGPRVTGDGYYESCVEGPEGNLLELTV
jgi:lactoylglutathione lyase